MTDFDRTAIGSLEDLQREWSGLDAERAKVEDRLRSFDAARLVRERPSIGAWRSGGGDRGISRDIGRGGRGGPGGGGNAGARLGENSRLLSGEAVRPRDAPQDHHISREKYRKMNGTWERGLDPDTAADEDFADEAQAYRPPQRVGDTRGTERATAGGRGIGRDDLRNRLRNGPGTGTLRADAMVRRGRRPYDEHDVGNAASDVVAEPDTKRPRVTSTIVVPHAGGGALDNSRGRAMAAAPREDGELDRWDAGGGGALDEIDEHAKVGRMDAEAETADGGEAERSTQRSQQRLGGSKIVLVSSTARGRRSARAEQFPERSADRLRNGSGGTGRIPGQARGSLASRLGPVVGRPVVVEYVGGPVGDAGVGQNGLGAAGEKAGGRIPGMVVVPEPPPMVEPSKPELQDAYKDGDTKKRNRRMFGGLMAHLGRARDRLEVDKTLIEKQQSMAETVAVRQRQEKRQQRLAAAEAARQERELELVKRDQINARQQKALIALHGNAFISNQEQLKGSIFTNAMPRLAWRPNEHTDSTQTLVDASNKEIDERIQKQKQDDDDAFEKIDKEVEQKAASRASRRNTVMGYRDGAGGRQGGRDRDANPYGQGVGRAGGKLWGTSANEDTANGGATEQRATEMAMDVDAGENGHESGDNSNDQGVGQRDQGVDDNGQAVEDNGQVVGDKNGQLVEDSDRGVDSDGQAADNGDQGVDSNDQAADGNDQNESTAGVDHLSEGGEKASEAEGTVDDAYTRTDAKVMGADVAKQPERDVKIGTSGNGNHPSRDDEGSTAMDEDPVNADGDPARI